MNKNYDYKKITPFKWFVLQNFPFIEEDFDAITNYQLFCKLGEEINKVINSTNAMGTQVEELTDYVSTYFDNLDVQDEIDNKLDEMAESGQLTDIIAQYLQLAGLLCFNTKSDMKNAQNLSDGSFAKTYGTTTYNDGYGNFYKIREILNTDVVDDDNIIALSNYNDLIAEKIPDATINEIIEDIQEINNEKLRLAELHKIKPIKFTALNDGIDSNGVNYYPDRTLTSKSNALPMVSLTSLGTTYPSVQGNAIWSKTGQILYVNDTEIYTMTYTNSPTKTTLFTDNYGHGGDSCIYEDNMYIVDADTNNIYKVNLQTGTKTTYSITNSDVKNSNYDYTPLIAGICMNDRSYAYILIVDDETFSAETGHKIQTGSTIRVYKFYFSDSSVEKLFEMEQDIVYGQGMTKDDEYFYIIGNKEFISNYTGSKLHIINLKDFTLYDTLENDKNEEFQGLDYGCTRGYEGLFTSCGRGGVSNQYGVLSFYGNYPIVYEKTNDSSKKIIYTKRNGLCCIYMYITGSFTAGSSVTINNVFDNTPKQYAGSLYANSIPIVACSVAGQSRNYFAQVKFDLANNSLVVLTGNDSPDSTYVIANFIYPCN